MFGVPYRRDFKVEECRVEKIIILTDADVDGAHISSLIERMFIMYYPQLIEAGMLYKAVPPLFAVKVGNKFKYFTENIDIVRYIQKTFLEKYKLTDLKKNNISNKDMTVFFMKNTDYIYHLERAANTFGLDPYLLEMILYHYILNNDKFVFEKLRKEIKSAYRFMDVYKEDGTLVVNGTIDKYDIIPLGAKFFTVCAPILEIMRSNDSLYYLLNGEKSAIYNIMKVYKKVTPSGIKRYKGLGEMSKEQLAESTLLASKDRTLIKYTMDDAKECLNAISE